MTRRTRRPAALLLGALTGAALLLGGAPAGAVEVQAAPLAAVTADCQSNPATAVRGAVPLCGNDAGRTITITSGPVAPGGTVTFEGTGFIRDLDGAGQTLSIRFNDVDLIGSGYEADDEGNVSGSVTIPNQATLDAYRSEYGSERFWLRFLTGSAAVDGQDDNPSRSLHEYIEITESDAPVDDTTDDDATGGSNDDTAGGETTGDDNGSTNDDTTGGNDNGSSASDDSTSGNSAGGNTTTRGSDSTTNAEGGELPQTGIEDHPGLLWAGALLLGAAALFGIERAVRSRRATDA